MDPTAPEEPAEPSADETRNARAKEYEAIHNRLFLVRIVLTIVILAVYLFSGASAQLAEGLTSRFGEAWWLVNGVYTLITVFGFVALLFPLSLYSDHVLEHHYELSHQSLGSWLLDFLKGLVIDLLLALVFFEVVYALLRWAPELWWAWAAGFYIIFVVVLATIAPVVIMPLFHKFEPLEESDLTRAVRSFVEGAGLKVLGVYQWGLEEKTATGNAALTGLGRTRRIILGDTLLNNYSQEEIIAVLAHEVGHYKHKDMYRLIAMGTTMAAIGFYVAHLCLRAWVTRLGFSGVGDIGSFPVFIFCLLVSSLIAMPFANAYSRRREFAADAYAVRTLKVADPLAGALEKLADQNLADRNPPAWIEFLLHSHPSIGRRVRRAREIEEAA